MDFDHPKGGNVMMRCRLSKKGINKGCTDLDAVVLGSSAGIEEAFGHPDSFWLAFLAFGMQHAGQGRRSLIEDTTHFFQAHRGIRGS